MRAASAEAITLAPSLVLGLVLGVAPAGCHHPDTSPPGPPPATRATPEARAQVPFLQRRGAHETVLRERGPSPASFSELPDPPAGVEAIRYPSDGLELLAWVATPPGLGPDPDPAQRAPALVYFHGDFTFRPRDFEHVRPFLDAGFVVMTPTLRGENGNPGDFELLWGEVDDARAAIAWLAAQPQVDPARIYAFGHSIGGGVVAMLSLYPDLPVRLTASCGGIYVPETFQRWATSETNARLVRFDPSDPDEAELRVLGPNLAWMVHPHLAYVGREDPWFEVNAGALADQAAALGKPFERILVDGDHMSSLPISLAAFLERVQTEAPP